MIPRIPERATSRVEQFPGASTLPAVISPAGERLYLPPSLRYFIPLVADIRNPGAHACFEYDVVEARRPEMAVDLGAGDALSFAVF